MPRADLNRIIAVPEKPNTPEIQDNSSPQSALDVLPTPRDGRLPALRGNFLPYPTSTQGPAIVPNDLSGFRSRGLSQTEKRLRQELVELHEQYSRAVDRFNWNQLVYHAEFRFEPVIGQVYHLYRDAKGKYLLSMVEPGQWQYDHVGSFRLNLDRAWEVVEIAPEVNARELFVHAPSPQTKT